MTVRGFSASEMRVRVQEALEADTNYSVSVLGNDRLRLARSFHPNWAIVLTVLTAPLVGLGLLFLLIKRTESCDVVVVDGPTSAVLTVTGRLLPTTAATLQEVSQRDPRGGPRATQSDSIPAASTRRSTPAPPPRVAAPPSGVRTEHSLLAPPPKIDEPAGKRWATTVQVGRERSDPTESSDDSTRCPEDATRARGAQPVRRPVGLCINGSTAIDLLPGRPVYVGRDPSGDGDCIALGDGDLRVSKTHLRVWLDGTEVRFVDLHSTNGSVLIAPGGVELRATPGEANVLQAGSVVRFGDQVLEVAQR